MLPWFQYTTINIGPIPIQVWGSFVALGMIVSLIIVQKMAGKYSIEKNTAVDLFFYMILFGLVGGRLFHVFFYEPGYFLQYPLDIIKIWQGGMSSFGGIFGALFGFAFFAKRNKISRDNFLRYADLYSFAALYGWVVGRIGCLMIHDHLGALSNSFLAIRSPHGTRLEMTILEMIGLLPLVIIFFVLRKKTLPAGFFLSILILYYGILRFVLDFFRAADIAGSDTRYIGLTPAQYFGIIFALAGIVLFRKKALKNKQ